MMTSRRHILFSTLILSFAMPLSTTANAAGNACNAFIRMSGHMTDSATGKPIGKADLVLQPQYDKKGRQLSNQQAPAFAVGLPPSCSCGTTTGNAVQGVISITIPIKNTPECRDANITVDRSKMVWNAPGYDVIPDQSVTPTTPTTPTYGSSKK